MACFLCFHIKSRTESFLVYQAVCQWCKVKMLNWSEQQGALSHIFKFSLVQSMCSSPQPKQKTYKVHQAYRESNWQTPHSKSRFGLAGFHLHCWFFCVSMDTNELCTLLYTCTRPNTLQVYCMYTACITVPENWFCSSEEVRSLQFQWWQFTYQSL